MAVESQTAARRGGLFSYENALVVILGVTFGVVFFDRQAASNLMPFIQPDLKLNATEVGSIGSALSATWALSAYLVGLLSDRTGSRKLILLICVIGFSVCSAISGLAPNYSVLLASRFFMGMLEGGVMPICLAIMVVESADHRRGLNAGIVQNGFSNLVGNSMGPIALVAIATTLGWRNAFYLAAAPGLLCAAAIWLWVKEPPKEVHADEAGAKMNLFQMLAVRNVLVCALISIFMVAWLVTGFAFLPLVFTTKLLGLSKETGGLLMSVLGFSAFATGALVPGLSDRFGRKPMMLIGCFGSVIATVAVIAFHGPNGFQGPIALFAILMVIGWVGNGIFPMFMGTVPGESLHRAHIATAMGIVVGAGEILGGVCGPIIAGRLADTLSIGYEAPMYLMAACALIAGVIALFLKETAPAKLAAKQAARLPLQEAA